jgi:hypothetical protein
LKKEDSNTSSRSIAVARPSSPGCCIVPGVRRPEAAEVAVAEISTDGKSLSGELSGTTVAAGMKEDGFLAIESRCFRRSASTCK